LAIFGNGNRATRALLAVEAISSSRDGGLLSVAAVLYLEGAWLTSNCRSAIARRKLSFIWDMRRPRQG
jgi:hypothetical protein